MSKAATKIAKPEDCPDWLDRTLALAYLSADYLLESLIPEDGKWVLFRFDQPSPAIAAQLDLFNIQSFAIITAFNPGSRRFNREENLLRHAQLREQLAPHCRILLNSTSQSPDGYWKEPGFWALDVDPDQAAFLGRAYGQLAIVCWQRGESPKLWWL